MIRPKATRLSERWMTRIHFCRFREVMNDGAYGNESAASLSSRSPLLLRSGGRDIKKMPPLDSNTSRTDNSTEHPDLSAYLRSAAEQPLLVNTRGLSTSFE